MKYMIDTPEATFCVSPRPNHRMKSGISATRGKAFNASIIGENSFSTIGETVIASAVNNAKIDPTTNAIATACSVISVAAGNVPSTICA